MTGFPRCRLSAKRLYSTSIRFGGSSGFISSASTIAIKVMLLTPAFRNLDASLEEALNVAGAGSLKTLLKIATPIMMPTILVAFILGLIRSLEAFEIELILGRPIGLHVFSTKIYSFMTVEPPQFAPASALGSFFLVVLGLLVFVQRFFLKDNLTRR